MRFGWTTATAGTAWTRAATSRASTRALTPKCERLAYNVRTELGERDYLERHAEPVGCVADALRASKTVRELDSKLPADLTREGVG